MYTKSPQRNVANIALRGLAQVITPVLCADYSSTLGGLLQYFGRITPVLAASTEVNHTS